MHIQKTSSPLRRPLTTPSFQETPSEQAPSSDTFTFSGGDNTGWKVAGMTVMLASVPMAIAARSAAVGAVGVLAGIGLMFGPDS